MADPNLVNAPNGDDTSTPDAATPEGGTTPASSTPPVNNTANFGNTLNRALDALNSENVKKEIHKLQNDPKLMGQLGAAAAANPQLAAAAPKLAGDPRINQFLQENPDMNRKKALEMKKQMNKAAHAERMKMARVDGCIINPSRQVKPVSLLVNGNTIKDSEINTHLKSRQHSKRELADYVIYFDHTSKAKNKRVTKLFGKDVVGSSVIIVAKQGPLTVAAFEAWEKSQNQN